MSQITKFNAPPVFKGIQQHHRDKIAEVIELIKEGDSFLDVAQGRYEEASAILAT